MTGPGSKKSWQGNPSILSYSMFPMLTDPLHMYVQASIHITSCLNTSVGELWGGVEVVGKIIRRKVYL